MLSQQFQVIRESLTEGNRLIPPLINIVQAYFKPTAIPVVIVYSFKSMSEDRITMKGSAAHPIQYLIFKGCNLDFSQNCPPEKRVELFLIKDDKESQSEKVEITSWEETWEDVVEIGSILMINGELSDKRFVTCSLHLAQSSSASLTIYPQENRHKKYSYDFQSINHIPENIQQLPGIFTPPQPIIFTPG